MLMKYTCCTVTVTTTRYSKHLPFSSHFTRDCVLTIFRRLVTVVFGAPYTFALILHYSTFLHRNDLTDLEALFPQTPSPLEKVTS